jgi:hypothetical protein
MRRKAANTPEGRTALSSTREYSAAPGTDGNRPAHTLPTVETKDHSKPRGRTVEGQTGKRRVSTMTDRDDLDYETPEADAAEQAMIADPNDNDDEDRGSLPSDIEAPEWDAQEQSQAVHVEDDYR